ncbi:prolipoprotein diacylglyceryl transferase [Tessaracoccus palaemonis]|uniref:Phosphatidylglycerol--prolipoprotein diacylglyceryl transferase n=1 Tax=Tessaracoccus palaemonis TaxID=2829499 RepID=A0ABX8SK71_9ACTN|nr:prolipoprotein diacylglyceryl transferase [Tessaracoccus palaemonis]QXT62837.1 prolipoprotein diacylglyceryl transferase [Tessaracoccus palaemonis]
MNPLVLTFPDFDPVAINIFGLKIHWYAIMYILAFAMAYGLMRVRLKKEPYRSITRPKAWGPTDIEDLLLAAIVGVLVGGRLGYCFFYQPEKYLAAPLEIFKLWDGGMSFHGGAIGVALGIAWYAWRNHRPFLQVADFLVPAAPIGLAAGRFGNFINGELWGREAPEWLPWAMIFPTGGDVPRHPSQLYQMLLEGVLLFILLWIYARKPRYRGQVAGFFLAGYGIFRFIAEYWREPDEYLGLLGLGFSMGQWLSIPMIVIGIALFVWSWKRGVSDVEEPVDNTGDSGGDPLAETALETPSATDADGVPEPEQADDEDDPTGKSASTGQ